MPKILVAECKQEVASFNPILSHQERFYKAWAAGWSMWMRRGRPAPT